MSRSLEGSFIVFEGTDGAGKSTQVDMLHERLESEGYNTLHISTPGDRYRDDPLVRRYNQTGESPLSPTTLAVMAAADRMRTIDEQVKPHLNEGGVVVCDRYHYSASAYFHMRGADMKIVQPLHERLLVPDFAVLLSIDALTRAVRLGKRNTTKDWEEQDMEYLDRVQTKIRSDWPDHFLTVDARNPIEVVHNEINEYIG
jgi:dTMP kinase